MKIIILFLILFTNLYTSLLADTLRISSLSQNDDRLLDALLDYTIRKDMIAVYQNIEPRGQILMSCYEISNFISQDDRNLIADGLELWLKEADIKTHASLINVYVDFLRGKDSLYSRTYYSRLQNKHPCLYMAVKIYDGTHGYKKIDIEGFVFVTDSNNYEGRRVVSIWEIRKTNRDKKREKCIYLGVGWGVLCYALEEERKTGVKEMAFYLPGAINELEEMNVNIWVPYSIDKVRLLISQIAKRTLSILRQYATNGDKGANYILKELPQYVHCSM